MDKITVKPMAGKNTFLSLKIESPSILAGLGGIISPTVFVVKNIPSNLKGE